MGSHGIDLSPLDTLRPRQDLAVRSALKDMLDRELAREAAAADGAPDPQHMASPGRFAPAG
ncbi:MAG: hypothetical protein QOH83_1830 [Solirubrobacteraceae bacterium]|jgi:hypothetical protein|nr:hypothetical protein [Solirubrobacteraceae bacterium]